MENVLGDAVPVGFYRADNIAKNIKIKVKLKKITNVCLEEKDDLNLQDSIELVNLIKRPSKEIEHIFSWQEKSEKQVENSENDNQKCDFKTISLKSLSDTDIFDLKWKGTRSSTYPHTLPSHIENLITNIKSRRLILQSHNQKTWQKPFFLHTKQLVKVQSCYQRPSPFPYSQSMAILALLDYEDSFKEEIELCHLRIDAHGVLTVVPDFSKDKPYVFLNSRSETFQYYLEDVQHLAKQSEARNKKDILRKIEKLHKKRLENLVGNEFFEVPPNIIMCYLNCEIISATNFLAQDIFIHYRFEIPDGYTLKDDLEGVTQACRCKSYHTGTVAYFGYIFSKEIEIDLEKFKSSLMPKSHLIIEVTSVDNWGNFRNEGYGYSEIVLKPGMEKSQINTWMLRPTTLTNQLRHYFIGGTPCLENLSYVRVPTDAKNSELSKFGLRTETSGQVNIRSSVVLQSSVNRS